MAPHAFSLLTVASLLSTSIALPFDIPHIFPRHPQASFSVVNVDGSSNPTSSPIAPTITKTISEISTVTPPASTFIATVNVDRGSTTETVYVTVTPTPQSTLTPSAPSIPPPYFHPHPALNATANFTSISITPTLPLATGTYPEAPCEETRSPVDDGAPWRHPRIPYATGTGAAYPTSYPTGYARPSDMAAPLPVLPVDDNVPYWFNSTEVPTLRKRVIVS